MSLADGHSLHTSAVQPLFVVPWQRLPYGRDVFTYADEGDAAEVGDVVSISLQGREVHGVVLGKDPHPPHVSLSPIAATIAKQWFSKPQLETLQWVSSEYATSLSTLCYLFGVPPGGGDHLSPAVKRRNGAVARLPADTTWLGAERVVLEVGSGVHVGTAILPLLERWVAAGKPLLVLCPTQRGAEALAAVISRRLAVPVQHYHGGLSRTEARSVWQRCLSGEMAVTVGTAAAALLPYPKLGGVALVDEADPAAKAVEGRPLLHLRSLALRCAEIYGTPCCLADHTPSVAVYALASANRWRAARVGVPPSLQNLTVREPHGAVSAETNEQVRTAKAAGQRVLILVPRRGEAGLLRCADCSFSPTCQGCGLPYTLPIRGTLRCRYCQHSMKAPVRCERCRGVRLRPRQLTVQSVAQQLASALPGTRAVPFESGQRAPGRGVDVVVATTVALYQLDIAQFSHRLVLDFDAYLQQSDFSSTERAYRMLRQVLATGPTTVESTVPSHPTFTAVADWLSFCRQELALRKRFDLPPAKRVVKLSVDGESESAVADEAAKLAAQLASLHLEYSGPIRVPGRSPRRRCRQVTLVAVTSEADLERLGELDYTTTTLDPDPVDFS